VADLLFKLPPVTNGNLLFGESVEPPAIELNITGSFPAMTFEALVGPVELLNITGSFPEMTVETFGAVSVDVVVTGSFPMFSVVAEAQYASNTARPTVGRTATPWQIATQTDTGYETRQQNSPALPAGWETGFGRAAEGTTGVEVVLPNIFVKAVEQRTGKFQDGRDIRVEAEFAYNDANRRVRELLNGVFQNAQGTRLGLKSGQQVGVPIKRTLVGNYQNAVRTNTGHAGSFQGAKPVIVGRDGRYEEAVPPPPGITLLIPPEEFVSCYDISPNLLFSLPYSDLTELLFRCDYKAPPEPPPPEGEVVVPVRKVYIVANNVSLRRASNNAPVIALSMSLSLDVDSWSWGFSASLPAAAQSLVEPDNNGPVELIASVNGTEFRVLVESLSRERVFGQATLRVGGRGRNARLDAPYAPIQTFTNTDTRTAQQLMNDALTLNGVPLGWDVVFELEDWSVPAGVFNHQGSYITALTTIAKSAGGYIVPHPNLQRFTVKPRYPVGPWAWNTVTPNFTLPADVAVREGLQWVEKPEYNRVFVSGQGAGVLGQVTRTGTAGELLAPMVVDQLITDTIAARQRGLSILADTGRQIRVGLRLPVLAETGIIQPGAFVNYQDSGISRLGLVRSVNVDVGFPEVWQSLEVETHV